MTPLSTMRAIGARRHGRGA